MNKFGHEITQEEVDHIMKKHDLLNNGVITYEEFKAMFLDIDDVETAAAAKLSN